MHMYMVQHLRNCSFLNRFGCLDVGLRFRSAEKSCVIIQSCLVLHNIAIRRRDFIEPKVNARLDDVEDRTGILSDLEATEAGRVVQRYYTETYFNWRNRRH